jgi:hypothetical protein
LLSFFSNGYGRHQCVVGSTGTLAIGENIAGLQTLDPYDLAGLLTGNPIYVTVNPGPIASLQVDVPAEVDVAQTSRSA